MLRIGLTVVIILLTAIPTGIYIMHFFKSGFSDDPAKWGAFGDYFGGIVGTLYSAVASVLALFSIIISLKITSKIQAAENKFRADSVKREKEKFDKEIELTTKQNKPLPYLELIKQDNITRIVLHNYGIGPLIVSKAHLLYDDKEVYPHFIELVKKKLQTEMKDTVMNYNSAPTHILPPSGSRELLAIIPKNEPTNDFKKVQDESREHLVKCKLYLNYEDLFENKSEIVFPLSFFNLK